MPPDRSRKWMEVLSCIISATILALLPSHFVAPQLLAKQTNFPTSLFTNCHENVKNAERASKAKNQTVPFGVILGCRLFDLT